MTHCTRKYTPLDQCCLSIDRMLRAILGNQTRAERPYPALNEIEHELTSAERKHAAGLMRVNHAGEVCAQALYHGQSCGSRQQAIQQQRRQAAHEEGDHLAWCSQRLIELGSHTSYLNSVWYAGSFIIGIAAGYRGDQWSLGFVAETEKQVVKHLATHLDLLPEKDVKSRKIVEQMQIDEAKHRDDALTAGAAHLPAVIKKLMRVTATFMVKTAYWI